LWESYDSSYSQCALNSLQENFDEMVRSDMVASAGARRVGITTINILLASRKGKKPSGIILFLAGY
ncbi:hypothetical protein, partial [Novacetimonas hansenii]|uniref:hypothetical protein n=1 Tax=Novacetimonas hansenii TaxID=436 RepID=UPI001A7E45D4